MSKGVRDRKFFISSVNFHFDNVRVTPICINSRKTFHNLSCCCKPDQINSLQCFRVIVELRHSTSVTVCKKPGQQSRQNNSSWIRNNCIAINDRTIQLLHADRPIYLSEKQTLAQPFALTQKLAGRHFVATSSGSTQKFRNLDNIGAFCCNNLCCAANNDTLRKSRTFVHTNFDNKRLRSDEDEKQQIKWTKSCFSSTS